MSLVETGGLSPWLVAAALVVLLQIGLVMLRNRIRRRIHAPALTLSPPTLPPDPDSAVEEAGVIIDLRDDSAAPHALSTEGDPAVVMSVVETDALERIIREELSTVFDDAIRRHDTLSYDECRQVLLDLADTTAVRVAARVELDDATRHVLDVELGEAVLAAFHVQAGDSERP